MTTSAFTSPWEVTTAVPSIERTVVPSTILPPRDSTASAKPQTSFAGLMLAQGEKKRPDFIFVAFKYRFASSGSRRLMMFSPKPRDLAARNSAS